jgi:c-di-GMP-binding flagellar brake protein YcgR
MRDKNEPTILINERRRHPRYSAQKRALVAVSGDNFGLPYHLIDISENGMAFRYLNSSPLPITDSQMDIYLNEELLVSRLPVTVVADRHLEGDFIPKRRCCVHFGNLTPAQQIQLQAFIRRHTEFA